MKRLVINLFKLDQIKLNRKEFLVNYLKLIAYAFVFIAVLGSTASLLEENSPLFNIIGILAIFLLLIPFIVISFLTIKKRVRDFMGKENIIITILIFLLFKIPFINLISFIFILFMKSAVEKETV